MFSEPLLSSLAAVNSTCIREGSEHLSSNGGWLSPVLLQTHSCGGCTCQVPWQDLVNGRSSAPSVRADRFCLYERSSIMGQPITSLYLWSMNAASRCCCSTLKPRLTLDVHTTPVHSQIFYLAPNFLWGSHEGLRKLSGQGMRNPLVSQVPKCSKLLHWLTLSLR